jgi:enoyl-[acyl-carrier-protein] reductase (NADH)
MVEKTAARTLIRRTVTMDEITDAALFLLENGGVNGVNLAVDGGWNAL